jgi:general secretion pathway protein D
MKISLVTILLVALRPFAYGQTMKLNGTEDVAKLVEVYAQATGQKFLLDPGVRGRVTLINKEPVSYEEAFHQISLGLAMHGYAVVKNGDVMTVRPARAAQRDLIEITYEVPALKPERLATWIITLKHTTADRVVRELRSITTRDGDIQTLEKNNQVMVTDYTSNLNRFAEILKSLDKPADPSVAKLVELSRKEREESRRQSQESKAKVKQ